MLELVFSEYYPLTKANIDTCVPAQSGLYLLAIRLVSGNHKIFLTAQSKNLRQSLRRIMSKDYSQLPDIVEEYIDRYKCYFTYFVVTDNNYVEDLKELVRELANSDQRDYHIYTN